jgi:glycosyltransferase involved in cell wall biosynthesis
LSNYDIDAHCLFLYGDPGSFQIELGSTRTHYLGLINSREILKFKRLVKFISEFQPNIVHHHDGLLWPHIMTFCHPNYIKFAHAHLDAMDDGTFSRGTIAARCQRYSTDMLICITNYGRISQITQGKYAELRTRVIYNGVNREHFYPPNLAEKLEARGRFGLPEQASIIGFVGRLDCAMKGVDDFIRMAVYLPDGYIAVVIGTGPDIEELKRLSQTLDVEEKVVFSGLVHDIRTAYFAIDVLCLTSHHEPFGLVVAEAMACHIPVVGFACSGGVNELLSPNTGWVVNQREPQLLAKAVIEAIEDREMRQERTNDAEKRLNKNHDWNKSSIKLVELYQQLVTL